jgi:hypothetical protein
MSGAQLLRKPRHRTPSALLRAGFIGWLLTWSMVLSGHAAAEEHWERNRRFYATVYGDIWAHTNLYSLPLEAAERDVRTAEAYFVGIGLGYALIPSFSVPLLLCACRVEGLSLELEGKFGRHFGLQDHSESVLVTVRGLRRRRVNSGRSARTHRRRISDLQERPAAVLLPLSQGSRPFDTKFVLSQHSRPVPPHRGSQARWGRTSRPTLA